MRIAHLLRKYNPAEWGGTETVIRQIFDGLRRQDVDSVVYSPRLAPNDPGYAVRDPLAEIGCAVKRFDACVPIWGISAEQRRQLAAVGGNLMSFDLLRQLWSDRGFSLIHSHALGRIGGIGLTLARRRNLPFVVTVHGGLYDLPPNLKKSMNTRAGGVEWGRVFGYLLRARRVILDADAILTCNPREAELIRKHHPDRRVIMHPHGVPAEIYETDRREAARAAFPQIVGRDLLVSVGRIDPVKNQSFLVAQMPAVVRRHPGALLVLAGPCTDEPYGQALERQIDELGLRGHVLLTGKLPPGDPRLIGLLQEARVALLSSVSETFGLVILEAWAAGAPAISSRTSGASALIEHGTTGWLFDLDRPEGYHAAIDTVLGREKGNADTVKRVMAAARERVRDYDQRVIAGRLKRLYQELCDSRTRGGRARGVLTAAGATGTRATAN